MAKLSKSMSDEKGRNERRLGSGPGRPSAVIETGCEGPRAREKPARAFRRNYARTSISVCMYIYVRLHFMHVDKFMCVRENVSRV